MRLNGNPFVERIYLELTSAEPLACLHALAQAGIVQHDLSETGPFCISFWAAKKDYPKIKKICRQRGSYVQIIREEGLRQLLPHLHRHRLFLLLILSLLIITQWIQSTVLIIEVKGNHRIQPQKILAEAEDCGLRVGVNPKDINSEQVKNQLISIIPDLKWIGVNAKGCRATIQIEEKENQPQMHGKQLASELISSENGTVQEIILRKGTPLISVGQDISKGDVLVSGEVDVGLCILTTGADADIFASTEHELTTLAPAWIEGILQRKIQSGTLYCELGKKRINLCFGSRNYTPSCGRIDRQFPLTLPGGYQLPVTFGFEFRYGLETEPIHLNPDWIQNDSEDYLKTKMIAGEVLNKETQLTEDSGFWCLTGMYSCREMIARGRLGTDRGLPWEN